METFDEYFEYWISLQRPKMQTVYGHRISVSEALDFSSDFIPLYIKTSHCKGKSNKFPTQYIDIKKWMPQYSDETDKNVPNIYMMDKHVFRQYIVENTASYDILHSFRDKGFYLSDTINNTAYCLWEHCRNYKEYNLLWLYFISKEIVDNIDKTHLYEHKLYPFIIETIEYFMRTTLFKINECKIELSYCNGNTSNILPQGLLFQKDFKLYHSLSTKEEVFTFLFYEMVYLKSHYQMCAVYTDELVNFNDDWTGLGF